MYGNTATRRTFTVTLSEDEVETLHAVTFHRRFCSEGDGAGPDDELSRVSELLREKFEQLLAQGYVDRS